MQTLRSFGAAILIIGFIYFILIRAIETRNYKRKSLYIFISGLPIFILFIIGVFLDGNNPAPYPNGKYDLAYYAFLITSFVFLVFFTLFYFIKGYKLKQKFKSSFTKMKQVPTIKNKKEYLYIIIKYENSFVLQKETKDEKELYRGIFIKFPHNEFFHDELVKSYIYNKKLDIASYKYIGKAIKKEKQDHIFYCYRILLNSVPIDFNNYEIVDSYKLLSVNLSDMDKKILFTSVVNEDFDIEL